MNPLRFSSYIFINLKKLFLVEALVKDILLPHILKGIIYGSKEIEQVYLISFEIMDLKNIWNFY